VTEDTLENDWNNSCFYSLVKFGSYFGLFDIFRINTIFSVKNKIYLHLLRNRLWKLAKGSLFYLFLKLVQINYIFSNNVHILYMYQYWIDVSYVLCYIKYIFNICILLIMLFFTYLLACHCSYRNILYHSWIKNCISTSLSTGGTFY